MLACAVPAAAQYVRIGPPTTTPHVKTPAQLEKEREHQAREARVNARIATMGKHREAEARRLVEMEEAARIARGQKTAPEPKYVPAERQCSRVDDGIKKASGDRPARGAAQDWVKASANQACIQRGGAQGLSMTCQEKELPPHRVPVPGSPLKFTSKPAGTSWSCSATFRCAQGKEVCGDGSPASVTRQ